MKFFQHSSGDFVASIKIHRLPMVYAIATSDLQYVKFGKTTDFKSRFSNIQTSCPLNLGLWMSIRSPQYNEIELELHRMFAHRNIRGEWFCLDSDEIDGAMDFFELTNKNIREVSHALL